MPNDDHFALTHDEERAGVRELLSERSSFSHSNSALKQAKELSDHPKRHGAKWSNEERNSVNKLFISGTSVLKISEIKERTPYSIAWQLHAMKLITSEQKDAIKDGTHEIYYLNRNPHTTSNVNFQRNQDKKISERPIENRSKENLITSRTGDKKNNNIELNFIELLTSRLKIFLFIWAIIIAANQIIIFNACFAPYCLLAALPHTGFIAAIITCLIRSPNSND